MIITINNIQIELAYMTSLQYDKICSFFNKNLVSEKKSREAIADTFLYAVRLCPDANPSDIWHHVIYRNFLNIRDGLVTNPAQSWVRTSGEGLEIFFGEYYNKILGPYGIRVRPLIGRIEKREALKAMGCEKDVGDAKLDTVLEGKKFNDWYIFGGAHVKASLAERVSDDVPTSTNMIDRGFFSPLLTLDVKSFPPPHGDLINRGEFGSPETPSEKRKYIEIHGSFDNCYSYNLRTIPSYAKTPSGMRIYTVKMNGLRDQFVMDCVHQWNSFSKRLEVI